jgi:hypothetical protein
MSLWEVKVFCRFCSHEFWAIVATEAPGSPDQLFEVRCPLNGSRLLFRLVKDDVSGRDERGIYELARWRPIERAKEGQAIASPVSKK